MTPGEKTQKEEKSTFLSEKKHPLRRFITISPARWREGKKGKKARELNWDVKKVLETPARRKREGRKLILACDRKTKRFGSSRA